MENITTTATDAKEIYRMQLGEQCYTNNVTQKVLSPGAKVVTRGLFSHGSNVSRLDAGCRRWRQTICDLRLQPRTQMSGSHPAGSCRASIFPLTSPDEICPPQKQSPTKPGRPAVAKQLLSL